MMKGTHPVRSAFFLVHPSHPPTPPPPSLRPRRIGTIASFKIFLTYFFIYAALHCSSGNSLDENHNIVLKDPSGVLETPGNPNRLCYWKIIAPKGRILRVEVLSIQLSMLECVEIVFKLNKRNPPSAKLCEQSYPSFVLYSLTNELGIKYQHYGIPTSYGFRANYTTILPG